MEQTIEHVSEGVEQLHKAEETQKNSTGMKCIITLCILISIMIILLYFKHHTV